MNNNLPRITNSSKTGNIAASSVQLFFEKKGWVYRRLEGSTDYGIDSEIEIVDSNDVTGKIFKCQIKGSEKIIFDSNGFSSIQINSSTWNNWKNINLPVIAILCDINTEQLFWTLPLAYEPKLNSGSVTLKFDQKNCVNSHFNDLESIINIWLQAFPKHNILREVPFFHEMFFDKLKPLVNWGDPWSELDEESNRMIRVFYSHVLELRSSLGFRNDTIIPFEHWLIRNQGIWDEPMIFYHGTISELIFYIGFFYNEALERLKRKLETVTHSFENNELIDFFKLNKYKGSNISIVYAHPDSKNEIFQSHIDKELKNIGWRER